MRPDKYPARLPHRQEVFTVPDPCALCGEPGELQQSHIIPNFAIRWIKKTSFSPFLRSAAEPDTRMQDYKESLLCETCEQRLNEWEHPFATEIFHPYVEGEEDQFAYEEWLPKFVISVAWRLLVSEMGGSQDHVPEELQPAVDQAEEEWREILLGERDLSTESRSHYVFFMDYVEDGPDDVPERFEFYTHRGTDATVVTADDEVHLYFKLPQIAFISCIEPESIDGFIGMEIEESGTIGSPQEINNADWGSFLMTRVRAVEENRASESEQEKIRKRMEANPEEALESESFQAYLRGKERRIASHYPPDYLNESCPVCGTTHRLLERFPNRLLTESEIESIRNTDGVSFARGVCPVPGEETKYKTDEDMTGTFVLSTPEWTKVAVYYTDVGWIVERAVELIDGEYPEEVGEIAWENATETYTKVLERWREAEG